MTRIKAHAWETRDIRVVRKPLIEEGVADHERPPLEYGVTAKRSVTSTLANSSP